MPEGLTTADGRTSVIFGIIITSIDVWSGRIARVLGIVVEERDFAHWEHSHPSLWGVIYCGVVTIHSGQRNGLHTWYRIQISVGMTKLFYMCRSIHSTSDSVPTGIWAVQPSEWQSFEPLCFEINDFVRRNVSCFYGTNNEQRYSCTLTSLLLSRTF